MKFLRLLVHFSLLIVFSPISFGQNLVFPHLADGAVGDDTFWSTELDIANITSSDQTAKLSFLNQNGSLKTMTWLGSGVAAPGGCGGGFSSITVQLRPHAFIIMETDGTVCNVQPQSAGWALVEGSSGIRATLIFRRRAFGKILAQAGVLPQSPASVIELIPISTLTFTDVQFRIFTGDPAQREVAFAIANADSDVSASGEIELVRDSGQIISTSSFTLSPRNQFAQFVRERFPSAEIGNSYLRIRVRTGAVSAVALSTTETLISTIPAN